MSTSERRVSRSDRPWLIALVAFVAAALAAIALVADRVGDWATSLETQAQDAVASAAVDEEEAGGARSVLVLAVDDEGAARSVALFTRAETGDGLVVLVPAQLFDLLPGFGEFSLARATVFADAELAAIVVQNVFGVRIDDVVRLDPGGLATALAGDIRLTLASPVVKEEPGESPLLVAEAGSFLYPAATVELLLTDQASDDPLAWLERQAAVWTGILEAMTASPQIGSVIAGLAADPAKAEAVLGAVAAGLPQVTLFPVERAAGRAETDGFTADGTAAARFVADRLSHLALGAEPRPRVEVLNGNGRLQATRPIVATLVRNGFRVVRTDNADRFDFENTLVIAQGNENRDAAERAERALGVGVIQLELTSPSGVVDVSIIVGRDVPAGEG